MGATGGSSKLGHQPALDGLRAVAVMMVLLFHGGVTWMQGGYFGVSVFFTLSGFLITTLLMREYGTTQRIAPIAFYTRRAKRLLPASTVCLAIVSIMASRDVWRGALHVRRDALGALFQVANWVQLAGGGSYTDLQSKSAGLLSPLDHYWSLAIEEQFYWLWPLCFWGLAKLARRHGWSVTRILLVITLFFAALAPIIAAAWGRDAAYWATPARAGEILIGALLAAALIEGKVAPRGWIAPTSFAAVIAIAVLLPAAGGPAYHGAFPLLAVASAGLLLGLQQRGPVMTLLSWRPLVALGAISYGVYLFHFPVFVFLSATRLGRGGWMLLMARLGITLAIAVASYWLIERPIRRASWSGSRTLMRAAIAFGVVIVAITIVPTRSSTYWTASAAAVAAAQIPTGSSVAAIATVPAPVASSPAASSSPASTPVSSTTVAPTAMSVPTTVVGVAGPTVSAPGSTNASVPDDASNGGTIVVPLLPVLSRPVRIVVVGDSTAAAIGNGLVQWAALNPTVAQVNVLAEPGCGFVRTGDELVDPGMADNAAVFASECRQQLDVRLPVALTDLHPDVVVLMTTINDVVPRQFDPAAGYLSPTDHDFLTHAIPDYLAIEENILNNSTAHVAWIRPPAIDPYWVDMTMPARDPHAHAAIEHVMATVSAVHPNRAAVIDLRAWMEQVGLAEDRACRPDGVHPGPAGSLDIATRFLGPELVAEATRTG